MALSRIPYSRVQTILNLIKTRSSTIAMVNMAVAMELCQVSDPNCLTEIRKMYLTEIRKIVTVLTFIIIEDKINGTVYR